MFSVLDRLLDDVAMTFYLPNLEMIDFEAPLQAYGVRELPVAPHSHPDSNQFETESKM